MVLDHYNDTYETVTTHHDETCTSNSGDGTSEEYDCSYDTSEQKLVSHIPVYVKMYVYDINEWTPERDVPVGAADRNPYWPQYQLAYNGQQVIGGEEVSSNSETYTVSFVDPASKDTPKKTYSYDTNQAEWAQYVVEESYTLKVNGFGAITNDPLADKLALTAPAPTK